MIRTIRALAYLRGCWLLNYTKENPGLMIPGLVLSGAILLVDLANWSMLGGRIDTETLHQMESVLNAILLLVFIPWFVFGLMTGLRQNTVEGLIRLWPLPVTGSGLMLAYRGASLLDPWLVLMLPIFLLLFTLFGLTTSSFNLLAATGTSLCLVQVCLAVTTIAESWFNRLMSRYLMQFIPVVLVGSLLLVPVFIDIRAIGTTSEAAILSFLRLTPTGVLISVFLNLSAGDRLAAFLSAVPLVFYAAGLSIFEWFVLRKALGEGLPANTPTRATNNLGWIDSILTALVPRRLQSVGPFIAKDLVAFIRFPKLWSGPFLMVWAAFTAVRGFGFDLFDSGLLIAGYGATLWIGVSANQFGLDRQGGVNYLMAPFTSRQVLLSKHLALWILILFQLVIIALCLRFYLPADFPPVPFYSLLLFNVYLTCMASGWGGMVSLIYPRMLSTGRAVGGRGVPTASLFYTLLVTAVAAIPAVGLMRTLSSDTARLLGLAGLAGAGFVCYYGLFLFSIRLLDQRRESLFQVFTTREEAS